MVDEVVVHCLATLPPGGCIGLTCTCLHSLLQVVVIAKLLEARPSFSNLFGLRSPSKTSLSQAQQAPSPRTSLGGGTPRRTSRVWDPQCDTVPEADQGG